MAPITWQNINAPDFSSSIKALDSAGVSFNKSAETLQNILNSKQKVDSNNISAIGDINTQAAINAGNSITNIKDFNSVMQNSTNLLTDKFGANYDKKAVEEAINKRRSQLQDTTAASASNVAMDAFSKGASVVDATQMFKKSLLDAGLQDQNAINSKVEGFVKNDLSLGIQDKSSEASKAAMSKFNEGDIQGMYAAAQDKFGNDTELYQSYVPKLDAIAKHAETFSPELQAEYDSSLNKVEQVKNTKLAELNTVKDSLTLSYKQVDSNHEIHEKMYDEARQYSGTTVMWLADKVKDHGDYDYNKTIENLDKAKLKIKEANPTMSEGDRDEVLIRAFNDAYPNSKGYWGDTNIDLEAIAPHINNELERQADISSIRNKVNKFNSTYQKDMSSIDSASKESAIRLKQHAVKTNITNGKFSGDNFVSGLNNIKLNSLSVLDDSYDIHRKKAAERLNKQNDKYKETRNQTVSTHKSTATKVEPKKSEKEILAENFSKAWALKMKEAGIKTID